MNNYITLYCCQSITKLKITVTKILFLIDGTFRIRLVCNNTPAGSVSILLLLSSVYFEDNTVYIINNNNNIKIIYILIIVYSYTAKDISK